MIIILRILAALNALIGVAMVTAAVWPTSDPSGEKKPFLVIIYLIWGLLFLGLAMATFNFRPVARKWTIGLYGFASFAVVWGFVSDVLTRDKIFVHFPWISFSTYLLFFAFFIWPVVFMFRPGTKEYFENIHESRRIAEEEAARASLKR